MAEKLSNIYLIFVLVGMSISPTFATEDGTGRNFLLIAIMSLAPLVLFLYGKIGKMDILPILMIMLSIINPLLIHSQMLRWSTVLFGVMFCLNFMSYDKALQLGGFQIKQYLSCIKCLIYAYVVVMVIQQMCVLLGEPIFNISNYDIRQPWKLNSLSAEPSHSVRYMALLMYSFISIKECARGEKYDLAHGLTKDLYIWISFIWVMVSSVSSTAFLFLFIILLKFLSKQNILILLCIVIGIILAMSLIGNNTFERTFQFTLAAMTFDDQVMIKTDPGAAARIAPMIICAKNIDLASIDTWLGHGIDSVVWLMNRYFPSIHTGGGAFALLYEYGLVSFVLYLIFSFKVVVYKKDLISYLFWFFLCLNEGFNMQITWSAIIFCYTNNYFRKNYNLKYD